MREARGRRSPDPYSQAMRRPPMKGMEVTESVTTPRVVFAAWTIRPLPMYMPTWLMPE